MNKELAICMDKKMVGPRLYCEYCNSIKVLSPCWCCQFERPPIVKNYCRGCGNNVCDISNSICTFATTDIFGSINWPESDIFNLYLQESSLSFQVKEGYEWRWNNGEKVSRKFSITISDFTYLKIILHPYINSKFLKEVEFLNVGNRAEEPLSFIAVFEEDLLTIGAEYYWLEGEFISSNLKIEFLGKTMEKLV